MWAGGKKTVRIPTPAPIQWTPPLLRKRQAAGNTFYFERRGIIVGSRWGGGVEIDGEQAREEEAYGG